MATNINPEPPIITVLPENKVFHLTEFHLALHAASMLAASGRPAKVILFKCRRIKNFSGDTPREADTCNSALEAVSECLD